jgi:hypothetical protein
MKQQQVVTLIGCILQMMVCGAGYMTGSISPYVALYFGVDATQTQIILPI